jgi:hypothetical protein
MKTCQECGKEETGDFKYCPGCDTKYESATSDPTESLWARATHGSAYLKYVWGWAVTQLAIGFLGLLYTTFRLGSGDLYGSEEVNELWWQTMYSDIFNWGLALLLTALALSAIRDFIRRN